MLLNYFDLKKKYNLEIRGIIHVGAHFGEEYLDYYKPDGVRHIVFFEPLRRSFEVLSKNVGDEGVLVNKALGREPGTREMYVETENNGQSSSLLKPKMHLEVYPHIQFPDRIEVEVSTLDLEISNPKRYNFLNIDVQGFELEVFRGGEKTLKNIDYIMAEVNRAELYEGCVQVDELDRFLSGFGFDRVETHWEGTWGDAFYIKSRPDPVYPYS